MADIQLYDAPWPAEPLGRVASDGNVYGADSSREPVGRVDQQGLVYDRPWPAEPVGRFEEDGNVYDQPWPAEPLGRVDASGTVYRSGVSEPVGRVDPPSVAGGAALLLLLLVDNPKPHSGFVKTVATAAASALMDEAVHHARQRTKTTPAPRPTETASTGSNDAEEIQPMRRVVGVCKFPAPNILLASDNEACTTRQQEDDERSHHELNRMLVEQRTLFHDRRAFIVVLGGGPAYLLEAFRTIEMADLFICCVDAAVLTQLGIPAIDAAWQPGGEPFRFGAFYDIVNREHYAPTAPEVLMASEGPTQQDT